VACRPADGQARPGRRRRGGVHDTLADDALPDILGGGTNDFVANAIYDAFFQISAAASARRSP
jgi:putative spermidine/putrescine transport system permease protein